MRESPQSASIQPDEPDELGELCEMADLGEFSGKEFRIRLSTGVATRAIKAQLRRFQHENGLKSEGEALEAIILALPSAEAQGRVLLRVRKQLKYLLRTMVEGEPLRERHLRVLREIARLEEGEEWEREEGMEDAAASHADSAPEASGRELSQGEGRDQVVSSLEGWEGGGGRNAMETI